METAERIKEVVRREYSAIAERTTHADGPIGLADANGNCGSTLCCSPARPDLEINENVLIVMAQDYQDVLQNYLSADEIAEYRHPALSHSARGIYSVTVFAQKSAGDSSPTFCKPDSGCC